VTGPTKANTCRVDVYQSSGGTADLDFFNVTVGALTVSHLDIVQSLVRALIPVVGHRLHSAGRDWPAVA